jgi:hypothetical protein
MATRTTSTSTSEKTSSQPYMSEYDKLVEERLTTLEAKAHTPCNGGGSGDSARIAALEARVEALVAALKKQMSLPL